MKGRPPLVSAHEARCAGIRRGARQERTPLRVRERDPTPRDARPQQRRHVQASVIKVISPLHGRFVLPLTAHQPRRPRRRLTLRPDTGLHRCRHSPSTSGANANTQAALARPRRFDWRGRHRRLGGIHGHVRRRRANFCGAAPVHAAARGLDGGGVGAARRHRRLVAVFALDTREVLLVELERIQPPARRPHRRTVRPVGGSRRRRRGGLRLRSDHT